MTPTQPQPLTRTRWFLTFVLGGRAGIRLAGTDFLLACFSFCLAFLLRFELELRAETWWTMLVCLPFVGLIRVGSFAAFRLYRQRPRFASVDTLLAILKGSVLSTVLIAAGLFFTGRFEGFPRSVLIIDPALLILLVGSLRFGVRMVGETHSINGKEGGKRLLIIGAGAAAETLLREIRNNPSLHYHPVGLIDDDKELRSARIHGVSVRGNRLEIPVVVERLGVEEIIFAIPSASGRDAAAIMDICSRLNGVRLKTLPPLGEIIADKASLGQLREVRVEDLLGRDPVQTDLEAIGAQIAGQVILVTGAAGSIGSELCRQIARFGPAQLVLFEYAENNLFFLLGKLEASFPAVDFVPVLASIQNRSVVCDVIERHRPAMIFHAAAHKHVPLGEANPCEVMRNNVLGTRNLVDAAVSAGVGRFVLVSTDKAVEPANFMGASKRLAELYTISAAGGKGLRMMGVRFGNVIGSVGSVFGTFQEQIAAGGPVTVTDPAMERFFMTIPEAVQLILQASTLGSGGELFVLDMGKPVRIYELARKMIRLSGFEPHQEIEIAFTGLRPGEKLAERLTQPGAESLQPTSHAKIRVIPRQDELTAPAHLAEVFRDLEAVLAANDETRLREVVARLIPTMARPGPFFRIA